MEMADTSKIFKPVITKIPLDDEKRRDLHSHAVFTANNYLSLPSPDFESLLRQMPVKSFNR